MKMTALIMAGGKGERFWPKSRTRLPKQFLSLTGDGKTMIQLTVERISGLVAIEDVYVATNRAYKELVCQQLPGIPEQNILLEPVGRNTAPCIGLGAEHIAKKYEDAIMLVLPSDHLIKMPSVFADTLKSAAEVAQEGENLVTLGITPAYPETGYGYIKFRSGARRGAAYEVERFVEKPDRPTAERYLKSGDYLWNSGMFIWKVSSIRANIKRHMPQLFEALCRIGSSIGKACYEQVLEAEFTAMKGESIDYGIMEKAGDIYILPGNFGWDDVGSWLAVERINPVDEHQNLIKGNVVSYDIRGCTIEGGQKLLAAVGLRDLIIVDTPDATLICDKQSAGEIKKILESLRQSGKEQYL